MKVKSIFLTVFSVLQLMSVYAQTDTLIYAGEKHFKNLRQLTFGGDNAEAYFSFDGKYLVFQRTSV
ncbi:MAG: hypothetical protein ACOVNR_03035, partial [Chitinophagaceae bacterium]